MNNSAKSLVRKPLADAIKSLTALVSGLEGNAETAGLTAEDKKSLEQMNVAIAMLQQSEYRLLVINKP